MFSFGCVPKMLYKGLIESIWYLKKVRYGCVFDNTHKVVQ